MRWWIALVVIGGCTKHAPPPAYVEFSPATYEDSDDFMEPEPMAIAAESRGGGVPFGSGGKRGDKSPSRAAPSAPPPPPPPAADPPSEPVQAAAEQPQRLVHYDGWTRMRVPQPAETVDAIADIATAAGGRVDHLSASGVTVRVPVAAFEATWEEVLDLGDVLDKRVRADDITEQFLAVDLRVRTLKSTRDRLVALLAKAKTEQEKLHLLEQITRVTEELDATESQLRTLADLGAMSKITVEVVPRAAFGHQSGGPELAGFGWLRGLSPFRHHAFDDDKRVPVAVPEGLVSLSRTGPFVAESADGTVLWTLRVRNDPVGEGDFWIEALAERIAEEFALPEERTLGQWQCLAMDEPDADEPYHWQVCLAPAGRYLHVAQAYFPSPEQRGRFSARVDGVLTQGGGS